MERFWHGIPVRVNLKNAKLPRMDGQISRWNRSELSLQETDDETLATLYFKFVYNVKYHGDMDILDIFQDEIARRQSLGPIGAEAGRGSFSYKDLTSEELDLRAQRTRLLVEILTAVYNLETGNIFYRLDAVAKILENLSDDEIAELCAVVTDRSYVDSSIWKEVIQEGLDRSSDYSF